MTTKKTTTKTAEPTSPNTCPKCGEPHAFAIMEADEAQLYVPVELVEDAEGETITKPLPSHGDDEPDEYRVYICPDQDERVVVLAPRGASKAKP